MIDAKALPEVKKHLETLANQLSLFENKVKDASEIEPGDKGPEEERERILSILASYQKKTPGYRKGSQRPPEKIMIELTKEPRCKARLKELFK